MLIRLLQQVSKIEFTPEVAPESQIPAGYTNSPGSDGTDRVWMNSHLTMFAKVCSDACVHLGVQLISVVQGGLWVKITPADDE